jgi:hypothetical protein
MLTTLGKDMVHILGLMATVMLVTGKIICFTARANLLGQMEMCLKVSGTIMK